MTYETMTYAYEEEQARREKAFLDGSLEDFLCELEQTPLTMMDGPGGASLAATVREALTRMVQGWMNREIDQAQR
jgi:hypothetical protein